MIKIDVPSLKSPHRLDKTSYDWAEQPLAFVQERKHDADGGSYRLR